MDITRLSACLVFYPITLPIYGIPFMPNGFSHLYQLDEFIFKSRVVGRYFLNFYSNSKETRSATMNIFRNFYFLFKSFVKVELSYVFTINLFTIAENCTEK